MKLNKTIPQVVLIAAIGVIILSIVFPVFSRARARARQASALSNVKQMELGEMIYDAAPTPMAPSESRAAGGGMSELRS